MPTRTNAADVPATRRARQRAQTTDEIKALARRQLADGGTGALSLRGIAREMGMAPAALFRYFETQAALITALCVDANGALAQAMSDGQKAAPESDSAARLRAAFVAARRWALAHPGDFALLSGTPIPGYAAQPAETGPAAMRVIASFMDAYLRAVAMRRGRPAADEVSALGSGAPSCRDVRRRHSPADRSSDYWHWDLRLGLDHRIPCR